MTTGSNAVVSGTNTSGLYGSTGSVTVQTGAYGNANVAAFLASYTGNLTAGNASVSGNITGGNILSNNYLYANGQPISFAGTYSNANVAAYLPVYSGNIAAGNGNITNDLVVGGTIYGTFSGNIAGNLVVPGANTEIIYNNAGNAGASSDFRFDSATRVMLLNGTANVANIIVPQTGTINLGNSRIQNVADPVANTDAVNKEYVDSTASGDLLSITTSSDGLTSGIAKGDNITFQAVANQTVITSAVADTIEIALANSVVVPGNITANYFIGNGSQLTGLAATYSNANVATFLAAFGSNTISTSGNITSGNIIASGQFLTNLPGANVTGTVANATYALSANSATFAGTVTTNAQPNITSVGTLTSLTSTGNVTAANVLTGGAVSATGNVTGNYIIGDGSLLTNLPGGSYGNANVANYLPTFGGNVGAGNLVITSTSGVAYVNNITGLAGQPVSITADGTEDIHLDADSIRIGDNNTDATLTTHGTGDLILRTNEGSATEGNIILRDGASGNIDIQTNGSGVVNITGTAGLRVADGISAVGNITGGNLVTTGQISATGNITGNYFLGNGSQLTGISGTYSNANVSAFLAAFGSNTISTSGNITSGNIIANGQFLTNLPGANVTGTVANASYALTANTASSANVVLDAAQPNITSVGTLTSVSVTGNVQAGNVRTAGVVSATGNITGNYYFGNGAFLTGISASVAGSNTEVQFNDAGAFGASANLTFNKATQELQTDRINLVGGNINFDPPSGTSGPRYITLTTDSGQPFYGVRIGPGATAANIPGSARDTVAIGRNAGNDNQGDNAIAIGMAAGNLNSGGYGVAIGAVAGANTQGQQAVAIGYEAGRENQSTLAVAIGSQAGYQNQGARSIAIGQLAGNADQGATAIAIGYGAGETNQPTNSIVLNANGTTALNASNSGFYVMPVRNDTGNTTNAVYYNTTTKELTYTTSGSGGYGNANVATFLANFGSNVVSTTGNVSAGLFLGNGSQLTGIVGGSNTQIQFNDSGAFAGNTNITFNKSTGNLAQGNIVLQTATNGTLGVYQNWIQQANPWPGNSTSNATMQQARYLFGGGLGANASSVGDFSTTYDPGGFLPNSRLVLADRITKSNVSASTRGFQIIDILDIDTPGTTATNSRSITSGAATYFVGGNINSASAANLINYGATLNVGNIGGINGTGPANITVMTNHFALTSVSAGDGSRLGTGINYIASAQNNTGNATLYGNHYGFTGTASGNAAINNYNLVYLQSGSGNSFGISTLPTTYRFINNQDWRSSSVLGPVESSLGRMYTITTTTGNVTLNWNNGTTQYVKPTGNITFAYANANTNSNGNLTHSVNLIVEYGTTAYTITLPTGNATIKYEGGTSTVPSTANAVVFITATAANINGSTTYLTSIGSAYS